VIRRSAAALLLSVVAGCGRGVCEDADVLACVDGEAVRVADMERTIARQRKSGAASEALATLGRTGRRKLLESAVDDIALARAAEAAGLDSNPEVVEDLARFRRWRLARAYVEWKARERLSPTAVRAAFEANPDAYRTPREVLLRHIVVESPEEAASLREEVVSGRSSFEEVARRANTDRSRKADGLLGWQREGVLVESLDAVAFSLSEGGVSEPTKSSFGWHILRVEGRRGGEVGEFEKLEEDVRKKLATELRVEAVDEARRGQGARLTPRAEEWIERSEAERGKASASE